MYKCILLVCDDPAKQVYILSDVHRKEFYHVVNLSHVVAFEVGHKFKLL